MSVAHDPLLVLVLMVDASSRTDHATPAGAENEPWSNPLPPITEAASEVARSREVSVVLLVATKIELEAVLRRMKPHGSDDKGLVRVSVGVETYYLGRLGAHTVAATMCEAGQTSRAGSILAATQAINLWSPKGVIMPGIAFGADPTKQAIADVLVSTQVLCYENQRKGHGRTIQRGPNAEAGQTLVNRFRNVLGWDFRRTDASRVEIRPGPVLSGEKLVDDLEFKQALLDAYPQAIGGEMEGGGLYAAAARRGVEWIVVKAICDWADGAKRDSYQLLAAAAAVSLVERVLSSEGVLDGLSRPKPDPR